MQFPLENAVRDLESHGVIRILTSRRFFHLAGSQMLSDFLDKKTEAVGLGWMTVLLNHSSQEDG